MNTSEQLLNSLTDSEKTAVQKFRQYLRIPTVHPDIDYEPCMKFLEEYGKDLELPLTVYRKIPRKPVAVFKWIGKEPNLPTIILNGHMDVVPAYEEKWRYKPFSAEMDNQGNIYGRGTQDMKCNSIQYLEAIRRLKKDGVTPKRTVYILFVPDEEIGVLGFREFLKTEEFQNLNVGFCLDESDTSPDNNYAVFYGEKSCWQFTIHCPGATGHGSLLLENTAAEKVRYIIDKFSDFRREELKKLGDPSVSLGDVTSVNLTQMSGGVQLNVIPEKLSLTYDVRISPTINIQEFETTLSRWCKEAGEGLWIEYEEKEPQRPVTNLDNNPYWSAIKKVAEKMNIELVLIIAAGATDSRLLREINIPAIGVSPMRLTQPLAHNNNEYINVKTFLEGILFYYEVIPAIANV